MSQVKSKNTKPELIVRKYLHKEGFRFRLHKKDLPGKPDLVLSKYRTIIFVNGCFWHGHKGCKKAMLPKTRTEWWENKMASNRIKDKRNRTALVRKGWQVLVVWQCKLQKDSAATLSRLTRLITRYK